MPVGIGILVKQLYVRGAVTCQRDTCFLVSTSAITNKAAFCFAAAYVCVQSEKIFMGLGYNRENQGPR